LRFARPDDGAQLAAIYAPIVADTAISFEAEPPDASAFARRIAEHDAAFPWIVATSDERVVGYAYASPWRGRRAYRFGAEVTVYVAASARGSRVGTRLYGALLALLREQGYRRAYAGIVLPNPASVALHEAGGFAHIGIFHATGFKFDRWHDMAFYECALRATDRPECDPLPIAELDPSLVASILSRPTA
jgi:phosphinothricin acetyltransferase